jgi:hypothetical protein
MLAAKCLSPTAWKLNGIRLDVIEIITLLKCLGVFASEDQTRLELTDLDHSAPQCSLATSVLKSSGYDVHVSNLHCTGVQALANNYLGCSCWEDYLMAQWTRANTLTKLPVSKREALLQQLSKLGRCT